MKKGYLVLLALLLIGILMVGGCTKPFYHIFIAGISSVYPEKPVVNEPVGIWLSIDAAKKVDTDTKFHWQVDGFDEEFITPSNFLNVTFDTPGIKNICVYVVTTDEEVFVNNFYFAITVFEEES